MAQFQQIVLDYLEHYKPEEFEALKAERRLRERMDELVDRIYEEKEREARLLKAEYPEKPEETIDAFAEMMAIASVAPMPNFCVTDNVEFEIDLPLLDESDVGDDGNIIN